MPSVVVSIRLPFGTVPLHVATPTPNGPSLQENDAATGTPCAYVVPSGGVVMVIAGPTVSRGQIVVVESGCVDVG